MLTPENFPHIHKVLTENGYLESKKSEWSIKIEVYDFPYIVPHWYDCGTKERAKIALKSLLNKTKVYSVTVFSPHRNPVSFHGYKFTECDERTWKYYYG